MQGNIVNFATIIIGSLVGIVAGRKITKEIQDILMAMIGICVIVIGIQMALEDSSTAIIILSILFGTIMGTALHIEERLNTWGHLMEKRFIKDGGEDKGLASGFIAATLLFSVGSMAIIGSLQAGLLNEFDTLYAKSLLDGIMSAVLITTMGIGVIFSCVSVFLYQGTIILLSSFLEPLLTDIIMADLTAVGGILIIAIGLNMMDIKKIAIGNLLPAIIFPVLLNLVIDLF